MKRIMLMTAACILISVPALSQDPPPPSSIASRSGYFGVGLAGGFMIDPDMGAGMVSLDYYITDEISVGPYFHIGGGEDDSYWGVSGQVKFSAPLMSHPEIRPYGFLGIGFVELDFEEREDDPEMTYLFPVGGGMEFEIDDSVILEGCGVFEITEDTFAGLMVGVRFIL